MALGPKAIVTVDISTALAAGLVEAAAVNGVTAMTLDAERIAVDNLSQPGQGRVYTRGSVQHRASAPGDPPAVDTGDLRRERSAEVFIEGSGRVVGEVIFFAEYAEALELGTEKMAPRPFLGDIPVKHGNRLREVFKRFARVP
jgi:hypothetical protein